MCILPNIATSDSKYWWLPNNLISTLMNQHPIRLLLSKTTDINIMSNYILLGTAPMNNW